MHLLAEGRDLRIYDHLGAHARELEGVPGVAYDRFIAGVDYYVSFDNETVGKLQAQTLVSTIKASGKTSGDLVMINGSPTDPNAASFKKGVLTVKLPKSN